MLIRFWKKVIFVLKQYGVDAERRCCDDWDGYAG